MTPSPYLKIQNFSFISFQQFSGELISTNQDFNGTNMFKFPTIAWYIRHNSALHPGIYTIQELSTNQELGTSFTKRLAAQI